MQRERRPQMKPKASDVTASSGNVFEDLGFDAPEEELAKAKLVAKIASIIADRKLTQVKAGLLLGLDQPKISGLLKGKTGGYSTERLIRFLRLLGRDVQIVVQKGTRAKGRLEVFA